MLSPKSVGDQRGQLTDQDRRISKINDLTWLECLDQMLDSMELSLAFKDWSKINVPEQRYAHTQRHQTHRGWVNRFGFGAVGTVGSTFVATNFPMMALSLFQQTKAIRIH